MNRKIKLILLIFIPIIIISSFIISLFAYGVIAKKEWKPEFVFTNANKNELNLGRQEYTIIAMNLQNYQNIPDGYIVEWDSDSCIYDNYYECSEFVNVALMQYQYTRGISFKNGMYENRYNIRIPALSFQFGVIVKHNDEIKSYREKIDIAEWNHATSFNLSPLNTEINIKNKSQEMLVEVRKYYIDNNLIQYTCTPSNQALFNELINIQIIKENWCIRYIFSLNEQSNAYINGYWNDLNIIFNVKNLEDNSEQNSTIKISSYDFSEQLQNIEFTSNKYELNYDPFNNNFCALKFVNNSDYNIDFNTLNISLEVPNGFENILFLDLNNKTITNNICEFNLYFSPSININSTWNNFSCLVKINYHTYNFTCNINIHPKAVDSLTLQYSSSTFQDINNEISINALLTGNAVGRNITYSTNINVDQYITITNISNTQIKLKCISLPTTNDITFILKAESELTGVYSEIQLIIKKMPNPILSISANKNTLQTTGEEAIITLNIQYQYSSTITWALSSTVNCNFVSSSDQLTKTLKYNSYVSNDQNLVVTITCRNINSSINISLKKEKITSVILSSSNNKTTLSTINEEVNISATITNPNGNNSWSVSPSVSSNFSFTKIDDNNYKIKYTSASTTDINVSITCSNNNVSSTINITIIKILPTTVSLTSDKNYLQTSGEVANLSATVSNGVGTSTWSVSPNINNITLNQNGNSAQLIYNTYVSDDTQITITITNNGISKSISINLLKEIIIPDVYSVSLTTSNTILEKNGVQSITLTAVVKVNDVVGDVDAQRGFIWDSLPTDSGVYKLNYSDIISYSVQYYNNNSTLTLSLKSDNELPYWGWEQGTFNIGGTLTQDTNYRPDCNITLKTYIRSDSDYYTYIFNRTLTIGTWSIASGGSLGTAWLYKRVSGYKYLFCTNLHVTKGMEDVHDQVWIASTAIDIFCASSNVNDTSHISANSYPAGDYQKCDISWKWKSTSGSNMIADFSIGEIDLSSNIGDVSGLKSRLDTLNSTFGTSSFENFRASQIPDNQLNFSNQYMWIGGYPYGNNSYTYFTKAKSAIKQINNRYPNFNGHSVSSYGKTSANEYQATANTMNLGGGASGSMVIDRYGEILGIYWGGWLSGDIFYGTCDMLIGNGYNEISRSGK